MRKEIEIEGIGIITILNPDTRRAQRMLRSYLSGGPSTLFQAYDRPSTAKQEAYNFCLKAKKIMNGRCACITGHSCHFFSFGCRVRLIGGSYLLYITPCNQYLIKIKEE